MFLDTVARAFSWLYLFPFPGLLGFSKEHFKKIQRFFCLLFITSICLYGDLKVCVYSCYHIMMVIFYYEAQSPNHLRVPFTPFYIKDWLIWISRRKIKITLSTKVTRIVSVFAISYLYKQLYFSLC